MSELLFVVGFMVLVYCVAYILISWIFTEIDKREQDD